jgi:hypothetical protein
VKREILIENGGMPDYGTEYFTDHAYMVVNCSQQGMVYINRALGHQAIHGDNFGFNQLKNLDKYKATPDNFIAWVENKLNKRPDWDALKKEMYSFVGRSMVEFSVFMNKSLDILNYPKKDFKLAIKLVFSKPYLKKWKVKYILLSKYPAVFNFLLLIKRKISG